MTLRGPALLGIAAVSVCALALVLPWYSMTAPGTSEVQYQSSEFGVFGISWTGPAEPAAYPGQIVIFQFDYRNAPRIGVLLEATGGLTAAVVALGVAILSAVILEPARRRLGRWVPALSCAAVTALLAATVAVMVLFPVAEAGDGGGLPLPFWGSGPYTTHTGTGTIFWGPGWAWYASIVAAGLFLSEGFLVRKREKAAEFAATRNPRPTA